MSTPTPSTSFLGGLGLALSVHSLMILNGSVFGVSGMIHRAVRGDKETLVAVAGLVLGGVIIGLIEGQHPSSGPQKLQGIIASGLLSGLGTKLSKGCTSGHMLSGLSRLSQRSIAATATFFSTAVVMTRLLPHLTITPVYAPDWNISSTDRTLLVAQAVPIAASIILYTHASTTSAQNLSGGSGDSSAIRPTRRFSRFAALLSTTVEFALALRLSNLTDPKKVSGFLLLNPFSLAFDPSLAFLALGAVPSGIILYHFYRGDEVPMLGGQWSIPKPGKVDTKLLVGAALFGLGWGASGLCPGPVVINLGRALATGSELTRWLLWLSAFISGGLFGDWTERLFTGERIESKPFVCF